MNTPLTDAIMAAMKYDGYLVTVENLCDLSRRLEADRENLRVTLAALLEQNNADVRMVARGVLEHTNRPIPT